MLSSELLDLADRAGSALRTRKERIAVAESSAGGLISAALLSVGGASSYYLGGAVVYTGRSRPLVLDTVPEGTRGATEEFARLLALGAKARMGADWALAETGATGPAGNPYGDPAGHAWVAVARPDGGVAVRNLRTGDADRVSNMAAFTHGALTLLLDQLAAAATGG
jgi:nicotinamide-nucleotide amidase